MGEIVVCGRGSGTRDGPEIRAFGGKAAGVGVLEGDGFVAAEAKSVEHEFIEIGLRFRRWDVFAAGEKREAVEEAEAGEVGVAPRVWRVGRETDRETAVAGGVEEGDDAGEDRLAEHQRVFDSATLELEDGVIGVGAEAAPRIKRVVGVADAADERVAIKGHAVIGMDDAVGIDERSFGIENKPVEVEDERANHEAVGAEGNSPVGSPSILR